LLEIQAQAQDKRSGSWVKVVINTIKHLRVESLILGNGEHIRGRGVETATKSVPRTRFKNAFEAVTQGDVVALEERSITPVRDKKVP